jgi:hypothetical protein
MSKSKIGAPYQPLWQDPPIRQEPQPWPPPEPFSGAGQNSNPAGTVPFPTPTKMPVGVWSGQVQMATVPIFTAVTIGSPIFDLRPEFRAETGRSPFPSVPIWKPSTITGGAGGKLWVQIFDTDTQPLAGLQVRSQSFGSIQDVTQIATCEALQDVTGEMVPTAASSIMTFVPTGAGYPVRFWQLRLTFTSLPGIGLAYAFRVHMAYY